ncbi:MAG: metallophosphoesterase [Gammaproteobacteria bacterium]|jgi:3',5'-cyclic AMP phosphodiesterase CpdA
MRLLHLTDPHLTSLEKQSLAGLNAKRSLSFLSWRRKRRFQHAPRALEHVTGAARLEGADQILVTGDLTHIGLPEEIRAARPWLESLGAPAGVMLVPGNHDLMARDSWGPVATNWNDYLHLPSDLAGGGIQDAFPVMREVGDLVIIGVASAHPTPVLMASGSLGDGQMQRLEEMARDARRQRKFCCLLIHHPPVPGIVSRRRALADAAGLELLLERQGVDLVLHGHTHRNEEVAVGGRMIYSTASASSVTAHAPAAYRIIDVDRDAEGWRVEMTLKSLAGAGPGDWRMEVVEQTRWRSGL